mmetsp:Transcript_18064/g.44910  ORF Transcript_18064/g.44910 Transcript_18064/m.44910 type:complete len:108 (+) Transcript_18064:1008-1331(+)
MAQKVAAIATHDKTGHLTKFEIERRAPGPKDVVINIKYSGICHSDLHQARRFVVKTPLPPFLPSSLLRKRRLTSFFVPFYSCSLAVNGDLPSTPWCPDTRSSESSRK